MTSKAVRYGCLKASFMVLVMIVHIQSTCRKGVGDMNFTEVTVLVVFSLLVLSWALPKAMSLYRAQKRERVQPAYDRSPLTDDEQRQFDGMIAQLMKERRWW